MSNSNAQSVSSNSTLANLLNITTTTETDLYNTTTSWNINSSWYPNNNYPPWNCPTCNTQPPVVDYAYEYTYSYIYYMLLLLLLIGAIACIKIGISRQNLLKRQAADVQRRAVARQQVERPYGSTNNCNNPNDDNSCHMEPKESDFPPAYDEVMQSYLMAKQQSQENDANEGAIGFTAATTSSSVNNLSTAISTLTIETDIASSNHASAMNLNSSSVSSITPASTTTTVATSVVVNSPAPPSYEHSMEMSNTKLNNDHIV